MGFQWYWIPLADGEMPIEPRDRLLSGIENELLEVRFRNNNCLVCDQPISYVTKFMEQARQTRFKICNISNFNN